MAILHGVFVPLRCVRLPMIPASRIRKLSSFSPKANSNTITVADCNEGLLHRYTAGRWLWDETNQLAHRYAPFDMSEPAQVASTALGSLKCVEFEKLMEGSFNKTFLLTMEDGAQAIARIPNPNAGRSHFSTASEVATMEFARTVLNIPTPKVLAWNSKASTNKDDLPGPGKVEIVKQLMEFERRSSSCHFTNFGGLYYSKDIPEDPNPNQSLYTDEYGTSHQVPKFCIGPTNGRGFFDDGRADVEIYRGPWNTVEKYLVAIANREIACLRTFKHFPKPQGIFSGPDQYKPTTETKLSALNNYLKIAKHLLPKDINLHSAVLWHGDLHTDNIFVDPDYPTKILSVIDWQSAKIGPLFLEARHPALLTFDGDIPTSFKVSLPDNFETLNAEEQKRARKLMSDEPLYKLYEVVSMRANADAYNALRIRETIGVQTIGLIGSLFSDGEPIVNSLLVAAQDRWAEIVSDKLQEVGECPLAISDSERKRIQEDDNLWREGVQLLDILRGQVGVYPGWDGWVSHDDYEPVKERVKVARERFLQEMSLNDGERKRWSDVFPFPVE